MPVRHLVLPILFLVLTHGATPALAQPAQSRFEVGAHAALLRLGEFDAMNLGMGARLSFDLSRWASVEGEVNYYPSDDIEVASSDGLSDLRVAYDRRRTEVFFGVKAGVRGDRVGVFAKARPGFARLTDQGVRCVGDDCARVMMLLVVPEYRTEFALDLGGVLEFYPSARTVARLDLGDTVIRHRSFAPPCPAAACTTHNFSSRLGLGFRF